MAHALIMDVPSMVKDKDSAIDLWTASSYPSVPILDHGYIRLIESWGSDERIIEAARMSTNKGFQGWGPWTKFYCGNDLCPGYSYSGLRTEEECIESMGGSDRCPNCSGVLIVSKESRKVGDEKLLAYLYNHKHATPFEMAALIIEVQAPIFVFREWHRHRTQSYDEMSARYTPLPDLNYVPTVERLLDSNSKNKQASSTGETLTLLEWTQDKIVLALDVNRESFLTKEFPLLLACILDVRVSHNCSLLLWRVLEMQLNNSYPSQQTNRQQLSI